MLGVSGERGRAGYPQQGPLTVPDYPRQNRVRSRVLPGTPVQDQQETGLQQRSEDRRGAEAGLETEQGTGMPVADLREGLGAQGCGWASQVGLVRLKPLSGLTALTVFFLTVQANCYFELRKIR